MRTEHDQSNLLSDCDTAIPEGGGGTPLQESNRDVPLDGVAFSRLEGLDWGRKFSDFGGK